MVWRVHRNHQLQRHVERGQLSDRNFRGRAATTKQLSTDHNFGGSGSGNGYEQPTWNQLFEFFDYCLHRKFYSGHGDHA
jgi:hypothetical protein